MNKTVNAIQGEIVAPPNLKPGKGSPTPAKPNPKQPVKKRPTKLNKSTEVGKTSPGSF